MTKTTKRIKATGVLLMLAIACKLQAQPGNPRITVLISTNTTCGANGTITIGDVGGGIPPYQYSKNNGVSFQTSNIFTGLAAGTYVLVVRDRDDRRSQPVTRQITQLVPPIVVTRSVVRPSCFNFSNGRIRVTVTGGIAPYKYSWSTNPTLNSPTLNNIPAGTYVVTISDSLNCTVRDTIVVTQPAILNATASGTNLNCSNNFTGTVTASVAGGTPPYRYLWNRGRDSLRQTQTNVPAGTYMVTVSDTNRCIDTSSVTIVRQEFSGKRYKIGDTTSCGIVFYVDSTSLDSINHCRRRYLICAFQDQDESIAWYNKRYVLVNSNNDGLFRKSNADKIIQVQGDTGRYAARSCARFSLADTVLGGCSNWYLPSKAELKLMYTNLVENRQQPLGDFSFEGYWSSLESSNTKAWIVDFFDGRTIKNDKANKYHIRAVRVLTQTQ